VRALPLLLLAACADKPGDSAAGDSAPPGSGPADSAPAGDSGDDSAPPTPVDADSDGFTDDVDCHDDDPDAYPGSHATEVPGDGIDVDCDGQDACRDLNCDGWPDLAFARTLSGDSYRVDSLIYWGGEAGFDATPAALPTTGAMGVAAADLDLDGYQDLVFNQATSDGEERHVDSLIFWGGPEGYAIERSLGLPTIGAADPTIADLDADGWPDLVFSNRYDGEGFTAESYEVDSYIYWGGSEGFDPARRTDLPTNGAARSAAADLDGDGWLDLAFASGTIFALSSPVYFGGPEGFDPANRVDLPTTFTEGVTAADLDADGHPELIFSTWCTLSCEADSLIYRGGPDGPSASDVHGLTTSGATDATARDLDGDGWLDVVFANSFADGFDPVVDSVVYYGGPEGFGAGVALPTVGASDSAAGDLDEDGYVDLIFSSFYGTDEAPAASVIYWGGAEGFDPEDRATLATDGAAGVALVGERP